MQIYDLQTAQWPKDGWPSSVFLLFPHNNKTTGCEDGTAVTSKCYSVFAFLDIYYLDMMAMSSPPASKDIGHRSLIDIPTPGPCPCLPPRHRILSPRGTDGFVLLGDSFSIPLRFFTLYFTLIVRNLNPIWTVLITTNLLNLNPYLLLRNKLKYVLYTSRITNPNLY